MRTVMTNFFSGAMNVFMIATLIMGMATTTKADAEDFSFSAESYPEEYCMALNIYFETRHRSSADAAAVSDVVLNRVKDSRYPNTICEVVYQGKQKPSWKDPNKMVMVRNKCQFSWYCDGKPDIPLDKDAWMKSQMMAWKIMKLGMFRGLTDGATHYHAHYVDPRWADSLTFISTVGLHKFYRWD